MASNAPKNKFRGKTLIIIIIMFIYGSILLQLLGGMDFPMKIEDEYDDTAINIYDATKIIENDTELRNSMEYFQNQTGITPVIFVAYAETWDDYYDSPMDYAKALYDGFITDDYHMVIFCTFPQNDPYLTIVEVYAGDEARELITSKIKTDFITFVDRRFDNEEDLEDILTVALIHTADTALKDTVDPDVLSSVIGQFVFLTFIVVFITTLIKRASKANKSVKCPRCGKYYANSRTAVCPHCSAVITSNAKDKVHNDHVDHGSHHKEEIDSDEEWREHFFGKRTSVKPRLRGRFRYEDDDNSTFNDRDYE